jgi:hypothetical protein
VGKDAVGAFMGVLEQEENKMAKIDDNTFAAACYDQNSIADLEQCLINGPDKTDMRTWNITAGEWMEQIQLALAAKREDGAERAK